MESAGDRVHSATSWERAIGAIKTLARSAGDLAGVVIVLMMLVNIADVVLRYTLSAPLPSSYELTQFCMVVIVYGGIAWCGLVGGHVALDLLGERLDRPGLGWLNASVRATSALLLFIVAWRSGLAAAEYYASGETSNMLRWPLYPFLAVTAAGAGLYGLILTMQAMNAWRASEQHTLSR